MNDIFYYSLNSIHLPFLDFNQGLINWTNFRLGRTSKQWEDSQDEWIVMTSTKWKHSS